MLSPAKKRWLIQSFSVFSRKNYKKYYLDIILRVTYDERKK